jgi:hypothetical protein
LSIRVGDNVFIRGGVPATVTGREELSGKLTLESDAEKVKVDSRHGYLNGLAPENRVELYKILDEVKASTADPGERVDKLRVKLEELELDPRNLNLSRYVKAEMVHIMNTFNIKPREYSLYEDKVR